MIVAVLADTHLRAEAAQHLPSALLRTLDAADLLLHAGDIVSPAVLAELSERVETLAVCGNNDHELAGVLPEERTCELDGVRTALVHDSGPRSGRALRLRRRFPNAGLVVFGHSHLPVDEAGAEGQWLFNPGSPTQRRRAPFPSMGTLRLADGEIVEHRIIPL